MAWLDEADLHATERLPFALDEAQMPLDLRRSALEQLVSLVPRHAFEQLAPSASRHPLLHPHAVRPRPAVRLSDAVEPRLLRHSELYGELLQRSGAEYGISIAVRPFAGETVVFALGRHERQFSERDRDVLDVAQPAVERALAAAQARQLLLRALSSDPPPGTAVVLLDAYGEIEVSSPDADRWLAEHFGAAQHPGWLPEPVASWLALPPRPPLQSRRHGRVLTVRLLPGEPHALLLEQKLTRA
jgi:hypothetical protein